MKEKNTQTLSRQTLNRAVKEAFRSLNPKVMKKKPIMFILEIGFIATLALSLGSIVSNKWKNSQGTYISIISIILLVILIGVNFIEEIEKRRNIIEGQALKNIGRDIKAKVISKHGKIKIVRAIDLRRGDIVLVEIGHLIPGDGVVIEGIALVDESAITGESAPVLKEEGVDEVIGGSKVISDWIKVKIAS